jgi:hypothetical protein
MEWKVWLEGHEFELKTLAELFYSGSVRVVADGDSHYITADQFTEHNTALTVWAQAECLLDRANGVARMYAPSCHLVRLSGAVTQPDGKKNVFLEAHSAEIRAEALAAKTTTGGVAETPVAPGPAYVEMAEQDPDAADVLKLLALPEHLDWVTLYKIYEIIRSNVGGNQSLAQRDLGTASNLDAFSVSANRPDVSGDGARHARVPGDRPPKRTMTLKEARDFVSQLAHAWMHSLTS